MSTPQTHTPQVRKVGPEITLHTVLYPVPVDAQIGPEYVPTPLYLLECEHCGGIGRIGTDPETGDPIFCDDCQYGIELHLRAIVRKLGFEQEWITRYDANRWAHNDVYAAVKHNFDEACALHDELSARLAEMKHEAINRPMAGLFEEPLPF